METDWTALHCQVFEGLSQCSEALQVLRKAEKIGKLVISVPPLVHDGTYVLSGGTGALGLFVGRALVEEGAQVACLKPLHGYVGPSLFIGNRLTNRH